MIIKSEMNWNPLVCSLPEVFWFNWKRGNIQAVMTFILLSISKKSEINSLEELPIHESDWHRCNNFLCCSSVALQLHGFAALN